MTAAKKKPQPKKEENEQQISELVPTPQQIKAGQKPHDWTHGVKKFNQTIMLMLSKNTADNLKAEYWQTKMRLDRMKNLVYACETGLIDISEEIKENLSEHYTCLNRLFIALEKRVKSENVDIMNTKPTPMPSNEEPKTFKKTEKQRERARKYRKKRHARIIYGTENFGKIKQYNHLKELNDKNGNQCVADGKIQTQKIRRIDRQGRSGGSRKENDCERRD